MSQDRSLAGTVMETIQREFPDFLQAKFKPCAYVDGLGSLIIMNKDCSALHEPIAGTNFEIIRDLHTNEIVGLHITNWAAYIKRDL